MVSRVVLETHVVLGHFMIKVQMQMASASELEEDPLVERLDKR